MLTLSLQGDGTKVQADEKIIKKIPVLANMLEDVGGTENVGDIPIQCDNANEMSICFILKWVERVTNDHDWFNKEFIPAMENYQLTRDILITANYLGIEDLTDRLIKFSARELIPKLTVEQIRDFFGEPDDLTPAQKKFIQAENAWDFNPEHRQHPEVQELLANTNGHKNYA